MSIKLATIRLEKSSAERLGFPTYVGDLPEKVENYNSDIVIRWGNSRLAYDVSGREKEFKNSINTSKAIRLNCCKDKALEKLKSVVLTPKIYKYGQVVPKGKKIVYRYCEHSSGNDFRILNLNTGDFQIEPGYYGKEFIDTQKEWRVWFVDNYTMGCLRVPHKSGLHPICRSEYGYKLKRVPQELHELTIKAAKAIGLETGCADILFKDGEYYFLELNSAPTLDHLAVTNFYKKYISILVKQKFPSL